MHPFLSILEPVEEALQVNKTFLFNLSNTKKMPHMQSNSLVKWIKNLSNILSLLRSNLRGMTSVVVVLERMFCCKELYTKPTCMISFSCMVRLDMVINIGQQ